MPPHRSLRHLGNNDSFKFPAQRPGQAARCSNCRSDNPHETMSDAHAGVSVSCFPRSRGDSSWRGRLGGSPRTLSWGRPAQTMHTGWKSTVGRGTYLSRRLGGLWAGSRCQGPGACLARVVGREPKACSSGLLTCLTNFFPLLWWQQGGRSPASGTDDHRHRETDQGEGAGQQEGWVCDSVARCPHVGATGLNPCLPRGELAPACALTTEALVSSVRT